MNRKFKANKNKNKSIRAISVERVPNSYPPKNIRYNHSLSLLPLRPLITLRKKKVKHTHVIQCHICKTGTCTKKANNQTVFKTFEEFSACHQTIIFNQNDQF